MIALSLCQLERRSPDRSAHTDLRSAAERSDSPPQSVPALCGTGAPLDILWPVSRFVVATSPHGIPDRPPIRVEVGERVTVGDRDNEWPAFVFVTAQTGSGWIPEHHLDRQDASALVTEAYETTELPTEEGEELEVLQEDLASGWLWCRARSGREGWVPERTLSPRP